MAEIDYFYSSNANAGLNYNEDIHGEMFVASQNYATNKVSAKLWVYESFGVPDTVYISLYSVADGEPDEVLAYGEIEGSELPTSVPSSATEVELNSIVELTEGTLYAIIVSVVYGEGVEYGGLMYRYYNGDVYDTGYAICSEDGGENWTPLSFDYTFGVFAYLPEKPVNPTPSDSATEVSIRLQTISWENGGGATGYNVYYGESGNLQLVSSGQSGTSFTVWGVSNGSPYDYEIIRQWRIDAVNQYGTTVGDIWTFTTKVFDAPTPSEDSEGKYTAENFVIPSIKRLVTASKNAIYYESL